jgi:hypothetical protein
LIASQYFLCHSCLLLLTFNRSFYSEYVMTGCPANLPLTHAPGQYTPFQAVVVEAHHCHQPQAFYAQLRQQGLTAIHFIPQLAAGDAALWGSFSPPLGCGKRRIHFAV